MSNFTTWRSLVDGEEILAIPDSAVFHPDDNDLDNFQGDTGDFSIDSSPALPDLETGKSINGDGREISSTSGLDSYPEQGQQFACYLYAESGGPTPAMTWAVQTAGSEDDMYNMFFREDDEELEIRKRENGSSTPLAENTDVGVTDGEWYDLEVDWETDGTITGRIYDVDQSTGERQSELGSVSATDTTFDSGGAGIRRGSLSGSYAAQFYRIRQQL